MKRAANSPNALEPQRDLKRAAFVAGAPSLVPFLSLVPLRRALSHWGAVSPLWRDSRPANGRRMSTHVAACEARSGFFKVAMLRRIALCGAAACLLGFAGTHAARAEAIRKTVTPGEKAAIVPISPSGRAASGRGATKNAPLSKPAASRATLGGPVVDSPANSGAANSGVEDDLKSGRALLAANDARAIPILRLTAQHALDALRLAAPNAIAARDGLVDYATTTVLPDDQGPILQAREQAARAHFWWGSAEVRLGDRDRAITALARAVILSSSAPDENQDDEASGVSSDVTPIDDNTTDGEPASPSDFVLDSTTLRETRRNASQSLNGLLRQGLPLVAPDDVLSVVASRLHGGLWRPRRFRFEIPTLAFAPTSSGAAQNATFPSSSREFLITSGKLFPSETRAPKSDSPRLWRVPPLYSGVAANALPSSLKMDRTVAGYERETSGPDAGLWRQKVRVFYASTYVTRDNRDDRPRAESLCAQFLKVAALMRAGANLSNRYVPDGVSTLWLCEVSALWPADDGGGDDAPTRPLRPPLVPAATATSKLATREIVGTPLSRPWRAGAWLDSAPGDILLFRLTQPRDEAEWLRELIHEYSHIAVPPFAGFAPPLEPFGNGSLGETLGMLWAASEARASLNPLVTDAAADITPRRAPLASNSLPTNTSSKNASPSNAAGMRSGELNPATSFAPVEAWEDIEEAPLFEASSRQSAPRIGAAGWDRAMETHVAMNALPALRVFNARGPFSTPATSNGASSNGASSSAALKNGASDDLRYLQGIAVYLERVYGARILSAALSPLASSQVPDSNTAFGGARNGASRRAGMSPLLNADSLLNSSRVALRAPFESGQKRLPIWLPGALSPLPALDAAALSTRAPLRLRAGQTAAAWLFVPSGASSLQVQWRAASAATLQLVGSRLPFLISNSGSEPGGTLSIATAGRAGWQRLIFRATGDLTLSDAWFERAMR